jgi:hypothetical protein
MKGGTGVFGSRTRVIEWNGFILTSWDGSCDPCSVQKKRNNLTMIFLLKLKSTQPKHDILSKSKSTQRFFPDLHPASDDPPSPSAKSEEHCQAATRARSLPHVLGHSRACLPPSRMLAACGRVWPSPAHLVFAAHADRPLAWLATATRAGPLQRMPAPSACWSEIREKSDFFFTCANQCLASRFSRFHRFSRMGPFCILKVYSVPRNCSVPFILPTEYRNGR